MGCFSRPGRHCTLVPGARGARIPELEPFDDDLGGGRDRGVEGLIPFATSALSLTAMTYVTGGRGGRNRPRCRRDHVPGHNGQRADDRDFGDHHPRERGANQFAHYATLSGAAARWNPAC